MSRTAKFTVILGAENQASATAKKAQVDVSKFLDTVKDKAKGPLGPLGDISAKLGTFGTVAIGVGATVSALVAMARSGAQAADAVEKLGSASGLSKTQIAEMRSRADEWNNQTNKLTSSLGYMSSNVTEWLTPAVEMLNGAVRGLIGGYSDLHTSTETASSDVKQLAADAELAATNLKNLAESRELLASLQGQGVADFGEGEVDVISGKTPEQARSEAQKRRAQDMADLTAHLNQRIETWEEREQKRQELIAEYREKELAATAEWNETQMESDRLMSESLFSSAVDNLEREWSDTDAMLGSIGGALQNHISGMVESLASGKMNLAQAAQGLFAGVLTQIGSALISFGTAGLLFSALGEAIPALRFLTGSSLGVPASLAAIAFGTGLVAGGAAIAAIGSGGNASESNSVGQTGRLESRSTRGFGDTWSGRSRNEPVGSNSLVVNFNSVTPADPDQMRQFVQRQLVPELEDAHRRGRLRLA